MVMVASVLIVSALSFVAPGSIAAGMLLALAYGLVEISGRAIIGIPRMVTVHGLLDAFGFTLCGLVAYERPRGSGADSLRPTTACSSPI